MQHFYGRRYHNNVALDLFQAQFKTFGELLNDEAIYVSYCFILLLNCQIFRFRANYYQKTNSN